MNKHFLKEINLDSFIAIDVETSGLNPNKDKIIELSACKYVNGELKEKFSELLNPQVKLSKFIINLTGIEQNQLVNKPSFNDVSKKFINFIKAQPIIGHNVKFDLDFINKEFDGKYDIYEHSYVCDTYYLAKIFLFYHNSFKLSSLCELFNIKILNSHRAEEDSKNTAKLFFAILKIINETDVNILSKINRCSKYSKIFNKDLIRNIIKILLKNNCINKKQIVSKPFYFINEIDDNIKINQDLDYLFSKQGPLANNIKNYEKREGQYHFTNDCINNIENSGILIAEADTGIGKSFSYLIACLLNLNERKIILSSSTHSLQDQLFNKDIPLISKTLNIKVKATIAKGMNNYFCKDRFNYVIENINKYLIPEEILEFLSLIVWSEKTLTGDIAECNSFRIKNNEKIWGLVKYETESCSVNNNKCFYLKMLQESKNSNIVIVNHSLLANSFLNKKDDILGGNYVCIIDEAHKFVENCREQLKESINVKLLNSIKDNINLLFKKIAENLKNNKEDFIFAKYNEINDEFSKFISKYETFSNEFADKFFQKKTDIDSVQHLDMKFRYSDSQFNDLMIQPDVLIESFEKLNDKIIAFQNKIQDLNFSKINKISMKIISRRCEEISQTFKKIFKNNEFINWINVILYKNNFNSITFNTTPFFIKNFINEFIDKFDSIIFCSATLTIHDEFNYFLNDLGINEYSNQKKIMFKKYQSNFFIKDQVKLFVLNTNYEVNSFEYSMQVFELISKIHKNIKKRMLVLCTSYRQINIFKEIFNKEYSKSNNIFFQESTASRQVILNRYLENPGSVLIGTSSFWEGIDLPNDMLEILLITKLPFSNPNHPIVKSKIDYYQELGMNSFLEYQLPEAILKLRQGIGRLIRNENDMGICILTDPRLLKKKYGRVFLENLNLNSNSFFDDITLINESKKFLGC